MNGSKAADNITNDDSDLSDFDSDNEVEECYADSDGGDEPRVWGPPRRQPPLRKVFSQARTYCCGWFWPTRQATAT